MRNFLHICTEGREAQWLGAKKQIPFGNDRKEYKNKCRSFPFALLSVRGLPSEMTDQKSNSRGGRGLGWLSKLQ